MSGDDHWAEWRGEGLSFRRSDGDTGTQDRLHRRRPETNDYARCNALELGLQPRTASLHFAEPRFEVNAAFAARFPLEVFDGVGDVDLGARDSGLVECPIEERAGRTDEGVTGAIFRVAGLLADKHYTSLCSPFAKHRLSCVGEQGACSTSLRRLRQITQRWR